LISSGANNNILQPNQVLNTSFPFINASSLPSLCNLLIVLPADENCTCSDVVFKLNNLSIYLQNVQICENKPLSVGISAQIGATYQWEVSGGSVDCATCATAVFSPPLGAPLGSSYNLILHEYSSECQREFHFTYTFGFPFALKPNNQTLCKGKTLELSITPTGATYNWSGPGIVNPTSQTQSLSAAQSATYAVTVTLPNGCTADTSVFITVLPSDTVQLSPIQTCEGVPVNILGQTTAQAGIYKLVKQKSNGCDSLVLQQLIVKPGAQTLENLSFCKGDTLKVYDQLFIQAGGQICKTEPGANGCDSTHCVKVTAYDPPMIASPDTIYGQILQNINLQGAAGYQLYQWTPVVPNCANCSAVNVQFDTAGFYEYTLIIGDGNQCVDTVVYRIVVFPPCNPKNVRIPNAFTPNGDNLNDTFKVVDREGSEVVGGIAIYDRWGEKVYASQNKLFWDGTIDGKPAPTDVYVYIIEIICAGTPEKLVGDVTLLR
jgi:gliding motility-associated-like protein